MEGVQQHRQCHAPHLHGDVPTKTASDGTVTPVNANEFLATNLPGNDERRAKLSALGFSIPAWFANQTSTTLVNYLRARR